MGRNVGASEPGESKSSLESILANSSPEPSLTVTSTIMEIETTLRRFGKQTSFLQANGALFPTIEPNFALFSGVNHENSSAPMGDCCLNFTGSTAAVCGDSISKNTIDFNADLNVSEQSLIFVNSQPVTKLAEVNQGSTEHSTITLEISTNPNCIEKNGSDQCVRDNAELSHNTDNHSSITFQNTSNLAENEQTRGDYIPATAGQSNDGNHNTDSDTLNHATSTVTFDQSRKDQAAPGESKREQEVHEMYDIATFYQGIADNTKTFNLIKRTPVDISDHKTANPHDSIEEIQSQHGNKMKLNRTHASSSIAKCKERDTSSIKNSLDSKLYITSMDSCEITYSEVNNTTSYSSKAGSSEHKSTTDKDNLSGNIHNIAFGHAQKDHNGTGTMDNSPDFSTTEHTSSNGVHNDVIEDKVNVASEKTITCCNNRGKFNSCLQNVDEESSERDVNEKTYVSALPSRTESHTNENNSSSDVKLSHDFHEVELAKGEEFNNGAEELIAMNIAKQFTTNEIDVDITNYSNTTDTFHLGTLPHAITDPIPACTVEHPNASSTTCSATAAVDRYLRKLAAQLQEERRQTQQYIEEISRLCNNTILYES